MCFDSKRVLGRELLHGYEFASRYQYYFKGLVPRDGLQLKQTAAEMGRPEMRKSEKVSTGFGSGATFQ